MVSSLDEAFDLVIVRVTVRDIRRCPKLFQCQIESYDKERRIEWTSRRARGGWGHREL